MAITLVQLSLLLILTTGSVIGEEFDYSNIKPVTGMDHLRLGVWYFTRWYLPKSLDVSSEWWDESATLYEKEGYADKTFIKINYREKGSYHCADGIEIVWTHITPGIYRHQVANFNITSTFIYANEHFAVQFLCIGESDDGQECMDMHANFWSRCKRARPQDTARGAQIMKDLNYPDLKRFIDKKHEMDCTPPTMEKKCKCADMKKEDCGYWANKDGGKSMGDDDDEWDEMYPRSNMERRQRGPGCGRMDDDDDDMYSRRKMSRNQRETGRYRGDHGPRCRYC